MNFRAQEAPVSEPLGWPYEFRAVGDQYEISLAGSRLPPLRLKLCGAPTRRSRSKGKRIDNVLYPVEESRGYQARGDLWSPGYFRLTLTRGDAARRWWRPPNARDDERARADAGARRRARPPAAAAGAGRSPRRARASPRSWCSRPINSSSRRPAAPRKSARARASGDEVRTVIAGYHWFTDWGRDTMISLEGLTLVDRPPRRGRLHPADLRALRARRPDPEHVSRRARRKGCITPPTRRCGSSTPSSGTSSYVRRSADARAAVSDAEGDRRLPRARARAFGIHVDPADGLLAQGAPGYQLTWMDAKVDDWVVTPRRGKAVEINALWFNALKLMEQWADEHGDRRRRRTASAPSSVRAVVQRALLVRRRRLSLRRRRRRGGGRQPIAKCRPNQMLAIALPHPVLRARALGAGDARRPRSAADARRPAIAGAGRRRITRRGTSAICARATPPITRARSGHGWSGRSSMPG